MSIDARIHEEESLNAGIRRVGIKLNNIAIGHTKNHTPAKLHETIHELRKRFKEIRALLRIVRKEMGEDEYKAHNVFYRDLGRKIADLRDAKANLEILKVIEDRYNSKIYKNAFLPIENYLNKHLEFVKAENNIENLISEIQDELKNYEPVIQAWPIKVEGFSDLEGSILKVYERGYDGLKEIKENPTAGNFHEWRKRAKYIRYQLDILGYIWPNMMGTLEDEFHELTNTTGDDHDLSNLIELLKNADIEHEAKQLFEALSNDLRLHLRKKSIALGEKLYYEKPEKFIKRIKNYAKSAERDYSVEEVIPVDKSI